MRTIAERLTAAAARVGARFSGTDATAAVAALDDATLVAALRDVTEARNVLDLVGAAASAEIERRSVRELGHTGLAQRTGHRTATSFIQEVTGQSAGDVRRATAAGTDLASLAGASAGAQDEPSGDTGPVGGGTDTAAGHGTDTGTGPAAGAAGGAGEGMGHRQNSGTGEGGGSDEGTGAGKGTGAGQGTGVGDGPGRTVGAWHAPLTRAFADGRLSRDQYDAIRRNLGEPPCQRYAKEFAEQIRAAWREAAGMLIDEARDRVLEDLRAAARLARDTLDPIGTQLRFEERFEKRSFRMWIDDDGQFNARIRFDDEAAIWARTILNAALRPRRGPRFVDAEGGPEQGTRANAQGGRRDPRTSADTRTNGDTQTNADTRTNEQLQYDTIMAVLRTGADADPDTIFGGRQPGVRIVSTRRAEPRQAGGAPVEPLVGAQPWAPGAEGAVGFAEETGQALPGSFVDKQICDAGTRPVMIDEQGAPLDVGREARLFTPRQRIAIAERDGGCLDCGAEPSRCEVHHIDPWASGGRTDVADGVLLCRNCHMRLHNLRQRIRREGTTYWIDGRASRPSGQDGERTGGTARPLRRNRLRRFEGIGADIARAHEGIEADTTPAHDGAGADTARVHERIDGPPGRVRQVVTAEAGREPPPDPG